MPRIRRRSSARLAAYRPLVWCASALVAVLVLLAVPSEAQAYPWLVRHAYTNCGACHADPSGGELLTMYGHVMSAEVLSTRWGGSEGSGAALELRSLQARSHAASAKNAPKAKAKASEETDESETEDADAENAEDADASADETSEDATTEGEDSDANAEEESSSEASASAEASAEASPFAGMGALTGPLLGMGPATESLLLGGSFRLATLYGLDSSDDSLRVFPMQLDLYGQVRLGSLRFAASVGAVKVPAGSPHGRAAQVTANQGDGYNLISRTHWVGFDFGEGAHTIRAGRLNLPFGIRMSEHVMWVRERTQTDRESDQQHGVALYMGFEKVRFEAMAILGNYQIAPDRFRERGYSAYVEYAAADKVMLGLSSLYTRASDDRLEPSGVATTRQAHGPFLRAAPSEALAILVEADVLMRSGRDMGYVGFLQLDLEPFRGFHVIGTGEVLDAGYSDRSLKARVPRSDGAGRPLPGAWFSLQWFFLPHFDMRVDAIVRQEKQILTQLHLYL